MARAIMTRSVPDQAVGPKLAGPRRSAGSARGYQEPFEVRQSRLPSPADSGPTVCLCLGALRETYGSAADRKFSSLGLISPGEGLRPMANAADWSGTSARCLPLRCASHEWPPRRSSSRTNSNHCPEDRPGIHRP